MTQVQESTSTKIIRRTFQDLVTYFPELTLSLTCSEKPELHVSDNKGQQFSVVLNLLEKSDIQVREAIFSIKEQLKLFDA